MRLRRGVLGAASQGQVVIREGLSGNEVLVKLVASGVCHSDLSVTRAALPLPPPVILGHEILDDQLVPVPARPPGV